MYKDSEEKKNTLKINFWCRIEFVYLFISRYIISGIKWMTKVREEQTEKAFHCWKAEWKLRSRVSAVAHMYFCFRAAWWKPPEANITMVTYLQKAASHTKKYLTLWTFLLPTMYLKLHKYVEVAPTATDDDNKEKKNQTTSPTSSKLIRFSRHFQPRSSVSSLHF